MLDLRNISGGWGPTTIVEDLSISISPGEVVAIVGRNGVGKSTLLELVSGRAQLKKGTIILDGTNISTSPLHVRSRLGLAHVPQDREVFGSLTVQEHFRIGARPGKWTPEEIFKFFPSLKNRLTSIARTLSGGEQQMLAIARAMLANPKYILMDEPSEGLAPVVVEQMVEAIARITKGNAIGLLLIEQRLDIAAELSSRCLVMERGKLVRELTTDQLDDRSGLLANAMGLY